MKQQKLPPIYYRIPGIDRNLTSQEWIDYLNNRTEILEEAEIRPKDKAS